MTMAGVAARWTTCLSGGLSEPCRWTTGDAWWLTLLLVAAGVGLLSARRMIISLHTLRAMSWTPRLSRLLSRWVRTRSYSDEEFFRADGAGAALVGRRKAGIERLTRLFA